MTILLGSSIIYNTFTDSSLPSRVCQKSDYHKATNNIFAS